MISVIILTRNEERDLPRCLEALRWCDDVHVVDSGSADKTVPSHASMARMFMSIPSPLSETSATGPWTIATSNTRGCFFWMPTKSPTAEFVKAMLKAVKEAPEATCRILLLLETNL